MVNAVFIDQFVGDQLHQLLTPPSDRHLQRDRNEPLSLPKLAFQLGRLGIQLGVARSGVGKLSLGKNQYLIEAFGDAFALWQRNGRPRIFWDIKSAVRWVKAERKAFSKSITIRTPRQANCR
jgi:hypothetical protein